MGVGTWKREHSRISGVDVYEKKKGREGVGDEEGGNVGEGIVCL